MLKSLEFTDPERIITNLNPQNHTFFPFVFYFVLKLLLHQCNSKLEAIIQIFY